MNLASRLEGLSKRLQRPVILSQATRDRLCDPAGLTALEPQMVAGLEGQVSVYAL